MTDHNRASDSLPEQMLESCSAYQRDVALAHIDLPLGEGREARLAEAVMQQAETCTPTTLALLQHLLLEVPASQQEAVKRLRAWCLEMYIHRELLPTQRALQTRQRRTVCLVQEEPIPFLGSFAAMAAERRRDRRVAIEAEVCTQMASMQALWTTQFNTLSQLAEQNDYSSLDAMWGSTTRIEPATQRDIAEQVLQGTEEVYVDLLTWATRKHVRLPPGQLQRHDILALFTYEAYHKYYQPETLVPALQACVHDLGLQPSADGRLVWRQRQAVEGPPAAWPLHIPDEIVLSYAPGGGYPYAEALSGACGRGLLWAYTSPELPLLYRLLGERAIAASNGHWLTEITCHPLWLRHYMDVSVDSEYALWRRLDRLYRLRRQLGRFLYTHHLYTSNTLAGAEDAYREIMISACHVNHAAAYYLFDVDWTYDGLNGLRSWSLAYAMLTAMQEQFASDWFRCPDSGEWLQQYWASALSESVDTLVQHLLGVTWEPAWLVETLLDERF